MVVSDDEELIKKVKFWATQARDNAVCILDGSGKLIGEATVANTRDAQMLARIDRFDPDLLYPVNHRGKEAQVDLELLQARDILVKNRSSLINHVRSSVKSLRELRNAPK